MKSVNNQFNISIISLLDHPNLIPLLFFLICVCVGGGGGGGQGIDGRNKIVMGVSPVPQLGKTLGSLGYFEISVKSLQYRHNVK